MYKKLFIWVVVILGLGILMPACTDDPQPVPEIPEEPFEPVELDSITDLFPLDSAWIYDTEDSVTVINNLTGAVLFDHTVEASVIIPSSVLNYPVSDDYAATNRMVVPDSVDIRPIGEGNMIIVTVWPERYGEIYRDTINGVIYHHYPMTRFYPPVCGTQSGNTHCPDDSI